MKWKVCIWGKLEHGMQKWCSRNSRNWRTILVMIDYDDDVFVVYIIACVWVCV